MFDVSLAMIEKSDIQLDLSGFNCPMPLLKTKQCLNRLDEGSTLFVKTTDRGSVRDFKSYFNLSDHLLIEQQQNEDIGEYYFLIQCG